MSVNIEDFREDLRRSSFLLSNALGLSSVERSAALAIVDTMSDEEVLTLINEMGLV